MNSGLKIHTLGQLLRGIGAILLLAAGVSFMLEGWQAVDSTGRYLLFLSYVLALSGVGIYLGWRVNDDKGARTVLGLAAASVAMQFSQLGALTYSLAASDRPSLPSLMVYQASGWAQVLLLGVLTLALLTPVVFLGFSALIRPQARVATAAYLAACLALLIPERGATVTAGLVGAVALMLFWLDLRSISLNAHATTASGIAARLMLLAPLGILIGRACFYPTDAILWATLLVVLGVFAFEVLPRLLEDGRLCLSAQRLGTLSIVLGWFVFALGHLPAQVDMTRHGILITLLPFSGILSVLSLRALDEGQYYRKVATGAALAAVLTNLVLYPGLLAAWTCLIVSAVSLAAGYTRQERPVFTWGGIGLIIGLGYHLKYAVRLYQANPWVALAALGLAILLTSSYLEKHARVVYGRLLQFRDEVRAWG